METASIKKNVEGDIMHHTQIANIYKKLDFEFPLIDYTFLQNKTVLYFDD